MTDALLGAHRRIASTDIDALHDAVEPLAVGHDLIHRTPGGRLDGAVHGLTVGSVNLVWVRYGGDGVVVETPPTGGEFAMCAPIAPMGVRYARRPGQETAEGSLVLSHDETMRMTPDPERGCLVIATSTGHLADHLSRYLGDDESPPPLRFYGVKGPPVLGEEVVEHTWRYVCATLDATAGDGLHPLAARSLEDALLTALLLGLPHTATPRLVRTPGRTPPQVAERLREWVHAHHDGPIGVADMARAVNVSVRQVQVVCQETWGVTPTQLLRGIRLDRARARLLAATPAAGIISAVAQSCGYVHMSRFAVHYRQRFGETPRATLQRSSRPG
ncbi:AraC family transcriptional regulator [Actinomadura flavalba]|uniref:AraC family transcriptional regulator n=1 Tax=Actinomadura flavalba TaxID=1120938 RepID=UPI000369E411|nr:AraC family transcriptional regulator [Actinomadura flavalba]